MNLCQFLEGAVERGENEAERRAATEKQGTES